jgi:hypothetical protein
MNAGPYCLVNWMRDAGTPGHDDGRGRVLAQLEVALPSLAGKWPGNRVRCA